MARLDGRVAIVTGAGRGIGAAVARLLAREGAAVVVNDLGVRLDGSDMDRAPATDVVDQIVRADGKAVADFSDISDHGAAERLIRTALDGFGRLDVLVNTAGILRDRMVFNMTEQEWDDVIRVHLKGTFNTTKFAAAHWRRLADAQAHNRIVNFVSVSGLHGAPGQPNYAAAKMGILGLTYSCANSLTRYGVTTNAISPGATTRMTASIPSDRRRSGTAETDDRSPDNVAPIVGYLASTESGWINGRILHSSGRQVALYANPEPISRFTRTDSGNLDGLSTEIEQSFGPILRH